MGELVFGIGRICSKIINVDKIFFAWHQLTWPQQLLFGIAILGFFAALFDFAKTIRRIYFLKKFISRFRDFTGIQVRDRRSSQLSDWLTENSAVLQHDMGNWGLAIGKLPGLGNVKNYPILIHTLTRMRNGDSERGEIVSCQDSLLHYLGVLKNHLWIHSKNVFNPFAWLRDGARIILLIPIYIVKWFGFFEGTSTENLAKTALIRVLTTILACVGLLGTIITIVTGWDEFIEWCLHLKA